MPHPNWRKVEAIGPDLLENPELGKLEVERILRSSKSPDVVHIFNNYPEIPGRLIEFTSIDSIECIRLHPERGRIAASIQLRGAIEDDPCDCCKRENTEKFRSTGKATEVVPPFRRCIRLENEQYSRCGNCVLLNEYCSHGDQETQRRRLDARRTISNARTNHSIAKRRKVSGLEDHQDETNHVMRDENIVGNDLGEFLILGDLRLPQPPKDLKDQANKLKQHLVALDKRDMNGLPGYPIIDIGASFAQFQTAECETWQKHLDITVSPDYLVRPSGPICEAPLAHRLNQPSYTTANPRNGETADPSNPCIAMVMHSMDQDTRPVICDHIHRRDDSLSSSGVREYNAPILEVHEKFTRTVSDSMRAKVELVYGVKIQERLLETSEFECLPLWGDFEGVVLLLSKETNHSNYDKNYAFRRILMCMAHPNRIFYCAWGDETSRRQDKVLHAAALMTGTYKSWKRNYYSEQKWRQFITTRSRHTELDVFRQSLKDDPKIIQPTILQIDDQETDIDKEKGGVWATYFTEISHSNHALRHLIPPALQSLHECTPSESDAWDSPADLPVPLFDWFTGQKHILFHSLSVSTFQDIVKRLESIISTVEGEGLHGLFARILKHQQRVLEEIDGDSQEYWHSRFDGQVISDLLCVKCGRALGSDDKPRFAVTMPGVYISRYRYCSCSSKLRNVRTKPASLRGNEYTVYTPNQLALAKEKAIRYASVDDLWEYGGDNNSKPHELRVKCIKCGILSVDRKAKWTKSNPSLYVENEICCKTCHSAAAGIRAATTRMRYIPVDETIPSTYRGILRSFDARWSCVNLRARLLILGSIQPASKKPRQKGL